jgi:hypothetical protein
VLARRFFVAHNSLTGASALLRFHASTSAFTRHVWCRTAAAAHHAAPHAPPRRALINGGTHLRRVAARAGVPPPPRPPAVVAAAARSEAAGDDEEEQEEEEDEEEEDVAVAKAPPRAGGPLPAGHADFWRELCDRCTRPSALSMLPFLDPSNLLGVQTTRRGVAAEAQGSIYSFFLEQKRRHPRKVLLVQVGDFYESMGYDAVMLVEHAALNPMGQRAFKAGCPLGNLHRTLDALREAGLSVAVCEEAPAERVHNQVMKGGRQRYLGGVVTPSSPAYVHGMVRVGRNDGDSSANCAAAPPTLGVAYGQRGFTLVEAYVDTRTYDVKEGLPEQALVARLAAFPSAPLYAHTSLDALPGYSRSGTSGGGRGRYEGASLAAVVASRPGVRQRYSGSNVVDALLQAVRSDLRVNNNNVDDSQSDAEFVAADPALMVGASRPLFQSAALALGIIPSGGVPNLLSSLLPPNTPCAVADLLRSLLLSPPPEAVAHSLRAANAALRECPIAMPTPPLVPAGKLARLINARECSASFLADIAALTDAIQTLWQDKQLRVIGEALIPPAQLATGRVLDAQILLADCVAAAKVVSDVVSEGLLASARGTRVDDRIVPRAELLGSGLASVEEAQRDGASQQSWEFSWRSGDAPVKPAALPEEMIRRNEDFRGLVRRERVRQAYDDVDAASAELDAAVRDDLLPFVTAAQNSAPRKKSGKGSGKSSGGTGAKPKVSIVYEVNDNCVWLKAPKRSAAATWTDGVPQEKADALITPVDRNGRPEKSAGGRHSTPRVEAANEAYQRATKAAEKAVEEALREAAVQLERHLSSLVGAAQLTLFLRLATEHTSEALRRKWCLPELLPEGAPWRMRELTPPWMERGAADTVSNTFSCDGMLLLTGPNMAGKSTVARAAGAAALLANCGLHVPAAAAQVPRFGAYYVRMASADSPSEGLSHWGLDMKESAALLDGAALGRGACVMLDELCQGTEVAHATAMAGTLLEALDASGARGVFATHLHGVLTMPLQLSNTTRMAMETARDPASGVLRPTMRMVPGECTESLAFEVAADCGIPRALLERAEKLLPHATPPPAAPAPAPAAPLAPPPPPAPLARVPVPPRQPPITMRPPPPPPPSRTLEDASVVLSREFAALFGAEEPLTIYRVPISEKRAAPPMTTNRAGVYVLRSESARSGAVDFYAGETDDMSTRLTTHGLSRKGAAVDALYVLIPESTGGKSRARELETRMIKALKAGGFPVSRGSDENNRNYGQ